MSGFQVAGLLLDKVEAVMVAWPPAPLSPRPKYVSIEYAPDPAGVAGRWKYARERDGKWQDPKRDEAKYVELQALGENPTHTDVAAVVGDSWAYLSCDGCDETKLVRAVRIEGPCGEGNRYCPTCIREAARARCQRGSRCRLSRPGSPAGCARAGSSWRRWNLPEP